MLVAIFLALIGVSYAGARQCCKTGGSTYTWCNDYCCYSAYSSYYRCCTASTYYGYLRPSPSSKCSTYNYVSYSSYDSYGYTANNEFPVWIYVIIGLGSFVGLVTTIVCCVCCVKGCTASNRRTGAVVVNPGQQGQGAFMISNTATQQAHQSQQPNGPGAQPGQPVFPQSYPGPSTLGPKQQTSIIETDVEKGNVPTS